MRLDRFDLNLLVVLDALLEERNVTKASQRLNIGQSGASAALKRLREHFEDELLVPVGRQMMLTPLAQTLVAPVRGALLGVRAALSCKPGFDPATAECRFVVCASDYVTTVLLSKVVQRLSVEAPGVTLEVHSPPRDFVEAFDRGGIDLLVMPEQYASRLSHPQLPLFRDTQACLVWTENDRVGETLSFDEYMMLGHVAARFGDQASVIMFEEWFLPRYGQQRRIECVIDNFSALALLIVGTRRVATVHRLLAEHFVRHMPLRLLDPPFDMPPVVETMVWPMHVHQDPAHVWIRRQMKIATEELAASSAA